MAPWGALAHTLGTGTLTTEVLVSPSLFLPTEGCDEAVCTVGPCPAGSSLEAPWVRGVGCPRRSRPRAPASPRPAPTSGPHPSLRVPHLSQVSGAEPSRFTGVSGPHTGARLALWASSLQTAPPPHILCPRAWACGLFTWLCRTLRSQDTNLSSVCTLQKSPLCSLVKNVLVVSLVNRN